MYQFGGREEEVFAANTAEPGRLENHTGAAASSLTINGRSVPLLAREVESSLVSNTLTEVTNDWEIRLFGQYPLFVEFDRRREMLLDSIRLSSSVLESGCTHELAKQFAGEVFIFPLELFWEGAWIREADGGVRSDTREALFAYSLGIPLMGDVELCALNPGISSDFPEGEIVRRELILSTFCACRDEAAEEFTARINRVEEVISLQDDQIVQFLGSLPSYALSALQNRNVCSPTYH